MTADYSDRKDNFRVILGSPETGGRMVSIDTTNEEWQPDPKWVAEHEAENALQQLQDALIKANPNGLIDDVL